MLNFDMIRRIYTFLKFIKRNYINFLEFLENFGTVLGNFSSNRPLKIIYYS